MFGLAAMHRGNASPSHGLSSTRRKHDRSYTNSKSECASLYVCSVGSLCIEDEVRYVSKNHAAELKFVNEAPKDVA